MKFNIIACINYNKAIGWKQTNNLIFNIPGELALFKKITTESHNDKMNIIVMGRKTWESLPNTKPLTGRYNCVISTDFKQLNEKYKSARNFKAFHNIDTFVKFARMKERHFNETFVIGGASIYDEFLRKKIIDTMFLTEIETKNYLGDVMFPQKYLVGFYLKYCSHHTNVQCVNNLDNKRLALDYTIRTYQKYSL